MARRHTALSFLAVLLLAAAPVTSSAEPPPAYFVDESKLPFAALPGTSTTRLFGIHNGAGYRIEVPDDWNGELVLYAHFTVGVTGGDIGVAPGNVQDNTDTTYQIDADPILSAEEIALNAAVLRVAQDPQGRHPNGLGNIPPISGRLPIPVLSLHTIGDLFVPLSMEQIYARRVAAEGAADLLVIRAIRGHTHCGFTVAEETAAFNALVKWVDDGVKPAGDDVLDAEAVANSKFGCAFTTPGHLLSLGFVPSTLPAVAR